MKHQDSSTKALQHIGQIVNLHGCRDFLFLRPGDAINLLDDLVNVTLYEIFGADVAAHIQLSLADAAQIANQSCNAS